MTSFERVLVFAVLMAPLACHSTYSLSISAPSTKTSAASQQAPGANNPNSLARSSAAPASLTTTPIATTLPPLVTTISLNNYIDSLAQSSPAPSAPSQQQQQQTKQEQLNEPSPSKVSAHSANDLRSSTAEEHDDSMGPAATTINNHSRNSQQAGRPPQYVDVSALVGRNMSSSTNGGQSPTGALANGGGGGLSGANNLGAAGLSGKSRSGLPECATQQVCNAIFVRMNYTQRLCECSANYNWKCSNQLDPLDGHTIELTRKFDKRIYTQIKTCEPLREVRACKSPQDWTLLALQSERSGKAHYVVVCKCPTWAQLEGPYTHNHPPYANIPGIRVYGMLCSHQTARSNTAQSYATYNPALGIYPDFPWQEALNVLNTTNLLPTLSSH